MQKNNWYLVKNSDEIITPGLLVYPDRIKQNIESMISLSGSPNRLIPHVKTYKMKEIVKFQIYQPQKHSTSKMTRSLKH